jgi:hypothetical protein
MVFSLTPRRFAASAMVMNCGWIGCCFFEGEVGCDPMFGAGVVGELGGAGGVDRGGFGGLVGFFFEEGLLGYFGLAMTVLAVSGGN